MSWPNSIVDGYDPAAGIYEQFAGFNALEHVLMLHYLVLDEVQGGSLQPNLDFYGPRTSHGSTLSPGVHAAMGSVWRTVAFGFAGLRPVGDALAIDPVLAPGWDMLKVRVRFRNSRVHVRVQAGAPQTFTLPLPSPRRTS